MESKEGNDNLRKSTFGLDSMAKVDEANGVLHRGYSHMFVVCKPTLRAGEEHTPLWPCMMRAADFVYAGECDFTGIDVTSLDEAPLVPTCIQRQQTRLSYMCVSTAISHSSPFHGPASFLSEALDFFVTEMWAESPARTMLARHALVYPWLTDDNADAFFELALDDPPYMKDRVAAAMAKTYYKGLVITVTWAPGSMYFTVQPGDGEQALLDTRFMDCSKHGQGVFLVNYEGRRRDDMLRAKRVALRKAHAEQDERKAKADEEAAARAKVYSPRNSHPAPPP